MKRNKKDKVAKKVLEPKKAFYIRIDTFNVDISFFISHTHAEMVEASKKISPLLHEMLSKWTKEEVDERSNTEGQMYPLERGYAVRLMFYKDSARMNIGLLSHEVSHLVNWILMDRRIKLTKDNDEVYAYLTEEITKKFLFKWY